MRQQTLVKLMDKLIRTATVTESGCVIINRSGRYPFVSFDGVRMAAHRAAYLYYHGSLPSDGHDVCHTCDVTRCIAQEHLVAATHSWNMRDRDAKGRNGTLGENSPLAKLTGDTVLAIFSATRQPRSNRTEIANRFGISEVTVQRIARRETWKHLFKGVPW